MVAHSGFQARQHFLRARNDHTRKSCQARHLDSVAAIAAAFDDLSQKEYLIPSLPDRHVIVANRVLAPMREASARASATAHAMLSPSKVLVPRPISSKMTRLRAVA